MPVNTTYLSGDTTVFSNISLLSGTTASPGANLAAVTVSTGTESVGTLVISTVANLFTNSAVLSLRTAASAAGMTIGQLRLVFQASGLSLMYSSGVTQYTIGESATSLAQS